MKHGSRSIENNCSLELFNAAIQYDKVKTLQLIHESEDKLRRRAKFRQIVLKGGYSNTKKMHDDILEARFRKFISTTLDNYPYFDYFFSSTLSRFLAIYSSTFTLSIEDRIKKAITIVSSQLGWPANTINCIINSNYDLCTHFEKQNISLFNLSKGLTSFRNDFELNITKDAVAAWRMNFSFTPDSIFCDIETENEPPSPKWDPIREGVIEANEEYVAARLVEIVKKEKEDFEFLTQAAIDLILLGVDLKKANLISTSLEKIENELLPKSVSHKYLFALITTQALGYAFLRQFDRAIASLSYLIDQNDSDNKYDDQLLGFAGSLFLMAEKYQEASKLFTLVFKKRKTPLVWPLHVLLGLDSQLTESIKHSCELSGFIDSNTGTMINEIIKKQHPEWNSEDELISPLMLGLRYRKESVGDKLEKGQHLTEENQGVKAQIQAPMNSVVKELWPLADRLKKIIEVEEEFWTIAKRKSEWLSIQKIAAHLDQMLNDGKAEIKRTIFNLGLTESCTKNDLIQKVLNEGKIDSSIFQQSLYLLDVLYSQKLKREKDEFESQKVAFQFRLENLNLAHLWPKYELTVEGFNNLQKELAPIVAREEKIKEIEKGLVSPATLATAFPNGSERRSIIKEILNKVAQEAIVVPRNLVDLVCSVDWDESTASILNDFLLVLKKGFSVTIDDICMIDNVLPFIVKISPLLGCSPLQIILQEPFLANSFNKLVSPSAAKKTQDILKRVVTNTGKALVVSLLKWAIDLERVEISKKFLLKWIDFDCDITPLDKVEMLSLWLDSIQQLTISESIKPDIECFRRLRDALVECKRTSEATVLVSALWGALADERILEGFEIPLYDLLVDLVRKGGPSSRFARSVLENPEWLIKQECGVVLFLHLCHLGRFVDLVEQAKYQFFTDFEHAVEKMPVLVEQFFLDTQFSEGKVQSDNLLCSEAEKVNAYQAEKDLERALKKTTCYKSWAHATEYQNFFNEKIKWIIDKINHSKVKDIENLEENISSIEPTNWIQEADRELHNKAQFKAREQMEKYLNEQFSRLKDILKVKKKVGDKVDNKNFIAYLCTSSKPLRERLLDEKSSLRGILPPKVVQIYQEVLEAVK